MKIFTTPFLLISALLVGCASAPETPPRPEWIDGVSSQYPTRLYLTGTGSARSLYDAKNLARADLSKSFQVSIEEKSHDLRSFEKKTEGDETTTRFDEKIFRSLITRSSRSVEGIEIVDTYFDDQSGQYYALAVLAKQRARNQFSDKIHQLDEATQRAINEANGKGESLQRAHAAQQAIDYQLQRAVQQASLQVVDPSGRGIAPKWSLAQLQQELNTLLGDIHIATRYAPNTPAAVRKMASAALSQAGFSVTEPDRADYILTLNIDLDEPIADKGWQWLRGSLKIELRDTDGKTVGVKQWPLKAASTTLERARARLNEVINETLLSQLRQTLLAFGKG